MDCSLVKVCGLIYFHHGFRYTCCLCLFSAFLIAWLVFTCPDKLSYAFSKCVFSSFSPQFICVFGACSSCSPPVFLTGLQMHLVCYLFSFCISPEFFWMLLFHFLILVLLYESSLFVSATRLACLWFLHLDPFFKLLKHDTTFKKFMPTTGKLQLLKKQKLQICNGSWILASCTKVRHAIKPSHWVQNSDALEMSVLIHQFTGKPCTSTSIARLVKMC